MGTVASVSLAALLLLPSWTAGAAADPDAVQLSSRDRALVTAAACAAGRGAGQLQPRRPATGSPVEVSVRCTPHRTEKSRPVAHVTTCSNEKGLWRCAAGNDALMVRLGDGPAMALIPGIVPAETALYLVTEADKLTVPPFHKPARHWLRDQCTVAQTRDATFRGGKVFELQCTAGSLSITQDCWKDRCRFFISGSTGD